MRVAFATLGCKVNQADTQSYIEMFRVKGYQIVAFEDKADIYVINTCVVTGTGAAKSRQLIRKAIANHPETIIVVTGCYPQTAATEVAGIPGVNLVVGMVDRPRLVELVEEFQIHHHNLVRVRDIEGEWSSLNCSDTSERTRAMLKIEEGCEDYCTYCIVPYARGRVRSMPLAQVTDEFKRLLEAGYQEIILTGIHLGAYGKDLGIGLSDLLKILLELPGKFRVRLGSIEPNDLNLELRSIILNHPKVCQHLHIPLQSGSDRILKLMGRRYDRLFYQELVTDLRATNPLIAIGTDLIVGFPGETEIDFENTCNFLEKISLSRTHVFRYSPRQGTAAAEFRPRIPKPIQVERSKIIQSINTKAGLDFAGLFIEREVEVIFEAQVGRIWQGLSGEYLQVRLESAEALGNILTRVKVTGIAKDQLLTVKTT